MFSTIWLKSSFCLRARVVGSVEVEVEVEVVGLRQQRETHPSRSNSAIMFVIISSPNCSTWAVSMPSMSVDDLARISIVVATLRSSSTVGASSGDAACEAARRRKEKKGKEPTSARSRWSFMNCSMVRTPSSFPESAPTGSLNSQKKEKRGRRARGTERARERLLEGRVPQVLDEHVEVVVCSA